MNNFVNGTDMPMGLGMALAKNMGAMEYFASLPESERQRIIQHTHSLHSKDEMQQYVNSLVGK